MPWVAGESRQAYGARENTASTCTLQLSLPLMWITKYLYDPTHLFLLYVKCGSQGHWLWTRPHFNVIYKSANAGQSADRGHTSHTGNHQGHTHWDHEVHARPSSSETMSFMLDIPPMQTKQKVEHVEECFNTVRSSYNPLLDAMKNGGECRLGHGKFWLGQADESIPRLRQVTELKLIKEWGRFPNRHYHLCYVWDIIAIWNTPDRKLWKAL